MYTLALLWQRDHGNVQRLLAVGKDDLLFCSRNCRIKKTSLEHFGAIRTGRHNDRIVLASLSLVYSQGTSQR